MPLEKNVGAKKMILHRRDKKFDCFNNVLTMLFVYTSNAHHILGTKLDNKSSVDKKNGIYIDNFLPSLPSYFLRFCFAAQLNQVQTPKKKK